MEKDFLTFKISNPESEPPINDKAKVVAEALTYRVASYIVNGLEESLKYGTKKYRSWVSQESIPDEISATKIHQTYRIVDALLQFEGPNTIRSWFLGINNDLDDASPMKVMTESPNDVLNAARAWISREY